MKLNQLRMCVCKIGIEESRLNFYCNDENKDNFDFILSRKDKSGNYEFLEIDLEFSGYNGYYLTIGNKKQYVSSYTDSLYMILKKVLEHNPIVFSKEEIKDIISYSFENKDKYHPIKEDNTYNVHRIYSLYQNKA